MSVSEECFDYRPNITRRWYYLIPTSASSAPVAASASEPINGERTSYPRPLNSGHSGLWVAASASEWTDHHSLALAATWQIKVSLIWAIDLTSASSAPVAASASEPINSEWTKYQRPSNSGLFGSRERPRVDGSPLAGARGYPANQRLTLLGD